MRLIKDALKKSFPQWDLRHKAYQKLIGYDGSYLYQTGWMQSLKDQKPVDSGGHPVPWMNFSVIKLLDERLTRDLNLFEFGSGYSTLFYAARVKSVTSVEYDRDWFEKVKAEAPANVELIFQEHDKDGGYCRTVAATGEAYDVVVIDGRDRVNCIRQSIPALSPRGVMILDDSHRDYYQAGIDYAAEHGFRALGIEGLKATDLGVFRTTILYRDGNCLRI